MTRLKRSDIPKDCEVQPLRPGQKAKEPATCGTCGLTWDDGKITGMTPAPSARCPFEAFHDLRERKPKKKLSQSELRETALQDAHEEIESTKILANTTGIRWIVFFNLRYGWLRTDTPSLRWLPIDRTVAVVYPHPELHDKKRELAWGQSHPVAPYLPHCTEIVTEHKWAMDLENGGIKPFA